MAERESIYLDGFEHHNPIPAASRIGPFVFSGVLTGLDPHTREMPAELYEQCANVFHHARAVMAAVGGSTDDVAKMTFWLSDYRDRAALNREWMTMFPDPASRPARQVVAAQLDNGALIHCDLIAILSRGHLGINSLTSE